MAGLPADNLRGNAHVVGKLVLQTVEFASHIIIALVIGGRLDGGAPDRVTIRLLESTEGVCLEVVALGWLVLRLGLLAHFPRWLLGVRDR